MTDSEAAAATDAEASTSGTSYSSEDRVVAREAGANFRRGDPKSLDLCQNALKRLYAGHAKDPKLVLNRAVLEYTRSGYVKTDDFLSALATAADLIGERWQMDLEVEISFSLCPFPSSGLPLERAEELDDVDQVVIFYNYAVVAFWQRQFRKADAIISRTIPFSEPLEESFSRRQSLLYLEVRGAGWQ